MNAPTQSRVRVFAYGSNMFTARLRERVPSAAAIGIGHLPRCILKWHKPGRDGSGKCDIERTAANERAVWGVIFELETDWKKRNGFI